jgi:hypothetical protein
MTKWYLKVDSKNGVCYSNLVLDKEIEKYLKSIGISVIVDSLYKF